MAERQILFSVPMVRAILAGNKTQTRRVAKGVAAVHARTGEPLAKLDSAGPRVRCPYGQPGDRLWVREGHYLHGIWSVQKNDAGKREWTFHPNPDMGVQFTEPNGFIKGRSTTVAGWYRRPSIHMPRWASRITLEVTGVRVERLQDISEKDAQAEGARECDPVSGREVLLAGPSQRGSFVLHYRDIWEQINGPGSWEANPWVWVVEFKRVEVPA